MGAGPCMWAQGLGGWWHLSGGGLPRSDRLLTARLPGGPRGRGAAECPQPRGPGATSPGLGPGGLSGGGWALSGGLRAAPRLRRGVMGPAGGSRSTTRSLAHLSLRPVCKQKSCANRPGPGRSRRGAQPPEPPLHPV